jgi:P4 family phage/plasmid primase-like protien
LIKSANEIRHKAEADKKRADMNILVADIDTCTDYSVLTSLLAPRISSEGYDVGSRLILEDKFKKRFSALAGISLNKKQLDGMVSTHTATEKDLTEVGNAQRLVEKYGSNLMYCPENAQWYRWDKSRWVVCVREVVLRMAEKTVEDIKQEAEKMADDKKKAHIYAWHQNSQRAIMQDNIIKLAQKDRAIMRYTKDLDADTDYIGVLNGAVYLKSGDLIPPNKNLLITHNTGIEYDPDARAPIFEQTVSDAFFGDSEMVKFLQRLVGFSLLGQPEREEIVVIPEGRGANGKSTIFNAIHHALGTYARYTSADTFVNARQGGSGSGAREDVLRLMGARFVYVTELEENGVMRESFIKSMTGGEAIPARGLYSKHTVEIPPTWIAFMPTNHLPIIKGEDKGIWRKICVVPFHRDFTSDPDIVKDVDRKSKLKHELPGILKWCVDGCLEYQKRGIDIPASIQRASDDYKAEMDLLSDWLGACCETGPEFAQSNSELWSSWESFARKDGMLSLISSANSLSRRLMHRGFQRIKNLHGVKGRGFIGLRLKGSGEDF